jgi:acyl carrier protein phosphodiesterase
MNILAHLYLSGGINDIMLGNFMGDFVKGNKYLAYTGDIQKGLLLHREIDTFTDKHDTHKQSRDRFRKHYGLYSGVVVDIVYDHFLASRWDNFHEDKLETFAQNAYAHIKSNNHIIPPRLNQITPYIIENNWLVMYKSLEGIERVLTGMSKRTSLPPKVSYAMEVLTRNYEELSLEFNEIISDLHKMVEKSLYLTKFAKI